MDRPNKIRLRIHGQPQPQGSKSAYIRNGRPIVAEGSNKTAREKHAAWRQAVATAARDHLDAGGDAAPDGPLSVQMLLLLTKPQSRRKRDRWVQVKPDVDKLARSVLDGLEDGGLLASDSRVSELKAWECYAVDVAPGALVFVQHLDESIAEALISALRGEGGDRGDT